MDWQNSPSDPDADLDAAIRRVLQQDTARPTPPDRVWREIRRQVVAGPSRRQPALRSFRHLLAPLMQGAALALILVTLGLRLSPGFESWNRPSPTAQPTAAASVQLAPDLLASPETPTAAAFQTLMANRKAAAAQQQREETQQEIAALKRENRARPASNGQPVQAAIPEPASRTRVYIALN